MGLYYWRWTWNGTPTSNFFSLPLPPLGFSRGFPLVCFWFPLVWLDSVRGSNYPLLVCSGVDSPELGDDIGDKAIYRGIIGGYFKTSLFWSIVVPENQRKPI